MADHINDMLMYFALRDLEEAEIYANRRFRVRRRPENAFDLEDNQFVKLFRLNKRLTNNLIASLEEVMEQPSRSSALTLETKVLATLRFFAGGSYQTSVGQDSNLCIHQSSVSRAITEVSNAINTHLFDQWVRFDLTPASLATLRQGFYEMYEFPGIIGAIDCTHVALVAPPMEDVRYRENDYFNHKKYHSINVQLVCDSAMHILNVNSRYPGRTHDAFIYANSNVRAGLVELATHQANQNVWLLGDSGYPLEPWLMTPIEGEINAGSPESLYNSTHSSTRNVIERCNGLLKGRFRCLLKHRVLHYSPEKASSIINACAVLHNMGIKENLPLYDEIPLNNQLEMDMNENQHPERLGNLLAGGRRVRDRLLRTRFTIN